MQDRQHTSPMQLSTAAGWIQPHGHREHILRLFLEGNRSPRLCSVWSVTATRGVPHPPSHTGCTAQCSPCKHPHRQTDRQTLSRLTARISPRWHFPTEKIRRGKEKQKAETTRKTPLSLSQGTDVIQPPASQDGKRCASSWPPCTPQSRTLPSEIPINSNDGQSAPSPSLSPLALHRGDRQPQMHWGVARPSFFCLFVSQSIN